MAHTGRSVHTTLKDLVLDSKGDRSDDALANALRVATKTVVLTQAAYNALTPDSNTIYIIVG